jgi:hypothetical protein
LSHFQEVKPEPVPKCPQQLEPTFNLKKKMVSILNLRVGQNSRVFLKVDLIRADLGLMSPSCI